jgi:prepilin-type N-terminal cleavage/methylation domain-containing protein
MRATRVSTAGGVMRRRGFTLLESLMVVTILGIIAAGTFPVMQGVATSAAASDRTRRAAEAGVYAMDRVSRLLRDTPAGATEGTLGLTSANSDGIEFSDGRALFMKGADLYYRDVSGGEGPLAIGVEAFEMTYVAADGVTDASATPLLTQRFIVRLVVDGFELRTAVLPRVRVPA